ALLPFSSRAPEPASLLARSVAYAIDMAILTASGWVVWFGSGHVRFIFVGGPCNPFGGIVVGLALIVFPLFESWGGAPPGKHGVGDVERESLRRRGSRAAPAGVDPGEQGGSTVGDLAGGGPPPLAAVWRARGRSIVAGVRASRWRVARRARLTGARPLEPGEA